MEKLSRLLPKDLYHSYVIESNSSITSSYLLDILEERGIVKKNSGDVFLLSCNSLNIEDSQKIKEWHKNKPIGKENKICIISAKFINREAEQSLLKVIEEPNSNTHFFIIVPDSSVLLGTILSRVHILKDIGEDDSDCYIFAEKFLNSPLKTRFDMIGEVIKNFKGEDSGGLRSYCISVINNIEKNIYEKWKKDLNDKNLIFILEEIKNSRQYLSTPGSSTKMILEHIAMILE